jgi:hypothetical protein
VPLVENGDAANRQQDDAFRRKAEAARGQGATYLVQNHAAKDNPDQSQTAQNCVRILRSSFGAPHES